MRNYRNIGKNSVSFLTALSSGKTLEQDSTGDGLLFHPALYINLLQPFNVLAVPSVPNVQMSVNPILQPNSSAVAHIPFNQFTVNAAISPSIIANELEYSTNYLATKEIYANDKRVIANQNLGNTKYSYEVLLYENS